MSKMPRNKKYTPTRALLDRAQMATEINASTQVVDRLKREGAIPFIQFGHFVRFDRDEVLAALQRYTIKARDSRSD